MEIETPTSVIISIVSVLIALSSFALSAYALYLTRKDKKPKLKVEGYYSRDWYSCEEDARKEGAYFRCYISNIGDNPIYLTQICFSISEKHERSSNPPNMFYIPRSVSKVLDPDDPQKLEPGEQVMLTALMTQEEEREVDLITGNKLGRGVVEVVDGRGNHYTAVVAIHPRH